MDVDLWLAKMTLFSRREPMPFPLSTGDGKSSKEEDLLRVIELVSDDLREELTPLVPGCCWSCMLCFISSSGERVSLGELHFSPRSAGRV